MKITKTLYVKNRKEWNAWLEKNHTKENEIWLIYYKRHTGKPRIPYDEAVEEALCFGWIDSTVQRVDDEKYAQRFTPRKSNSIWSDSNKRRVKKLISEGRMTKAGLGKINLSEIQGVREKTLKKRLSIPRYFKEALQENKIALQNFSQLAVSYKRMYVAWISDAKKEETRRQRIEKAIKLLEQNKKLGMV